jgi:hypothetical protein
MMSTILVLLAVNLIGYLVIYLVLNERIRRAASPASQMQEFREEVNRLVIELNQTTDRNIALIEDRIASLMELLAKTDKKMGLLKRESEKHEVGAKVYSRIREAKAPSGTGQPSTGPETGSRGRQEPEVPSVQLDLRDRVVALFRAGFTASLIASRVGAPLGEVELIIALERQKESP